MKKLWILPILALALTLLAPVAQADSSPASEPLDCGPDHLTHAVTGPCQNPDIDSRPDVCVIEGWVESASCTVTPTSSFSGTVKTHEFGVPGQGSSEAKPELGVGQWQANAQMTITDLSTSQVVLQASSSATAPLTDPLAPVSSTAKISVSEQVSTSGPFLCEISGTHSPFGVLAAKPDGTPITEVPNYLVCSAR